MTRRRLSQRSRLIIELRHARGISPVSIAGELGTTVQRVEAVIRELDASPRPTCPQAPRAPPWPAR